MRIRRWTPVAVLAFVGLVACGGGDQQAQTGGEEEAEVAGQQAERMQGDSLFLAPKNQSGIQGEAVIARQEDAIRVRLTLNGVTPGSRYPVHLHSGRCRAGGPVATALTEVSAQTSTATTAITFSASSVTPGDSYYLQAHLPDGTPAACVNVPAGAFLSSEGG